MPHFELYTTLSADRVPNDFQANVIKLFANVCNKEPKNIWFTLFTNQNIFLGADPKARPVHKAYAVMRRITVTTEVNRRLAHDLAAIVKRELAIDGDMFRIFFMTDDVSMLSTEGKLLIDIDIDKHYIKAKL